jgi:hypothetical protein
MVEYRSIYGHSKFKIGSERYETDVDGIVLTDDAKIIEFLNNNNNFVCLELPPTPAPKEEVIPSSAGFKKGKRK